VGPIGSDIFTLSLSKGEVWMRFYKLILRQAQDEDLTTLMLSLLKHDLHCHSRPTGAASAAAGGKGNPGLSTN
jgi:hypothetical protein